LIVLIHGSSAHGGLYQALGEGLANFGTVIVPDLRGHGGQTPIGDVNYIGQLEDDLADLVAATRSSEDQKVIFVGHSSGGGLLVRYAGNPRQPPADAVVLLSPYLGFNAPTMREDAGGWAQPLTRRILGLTLLNAVKLKALNHLPVIYFRLPEGGESLNMVSSYTHRMNESFAPRYDFKKDIAGLPSFLILVGKNDEAFIAEAYEPLLDSFDNNGRVQVIDGLSHLDVIGSSEIHQAVGEFITGF